MNYCSHCGSSKIELVIPEGDSRARWCCPDCNTIHYQNPRIIAGSLVVKSGRVMLCRRAIEPRYGLWNLPAGFLENGESVEEGAIREIWEEAMARVRISHLHTLYNLPQFNQVYLIYLSELEGEAFGAGEETLEIDWFQPEEIPWSELAFESTKFALTKWIEQEFPDKRVYQGSLVLKDWNQKKGSC